jgi:hypothetical protein
VISIVCDDRSLVSLGRLFRLRMLSHWSVSSYKRLLLNNVEYTSNSTVVIDLKRYIFLIRFAMVV